VKIIQMLQI